MTAPAPGPAALARRDPALDLLRSVALARVVLWHTFAATWLTFFAAMPLLFFVAGTLLAASRDRRSHPAVLLGRCRRLLPPLWVYGAAVALAGALRAGFGDGPALPSLAGVRAAVTWLVPVVDPTGSDWHGGWLSTHLWYIRAYLWVLLLAPGFAALARRLPLAIPLLTAGAAALELAARLGVPVVGSGTAHVLIGDALTYGAFVVLGMAYWRRRRDPDRLLLGAGALAAGVASVVYAVATGLPAGGVNESYPVVALTGLAWLLAAGAAETPIRRLAEVPFVRRATLAVSRRAVTVYLWHPAAIMVAYVAADRWIPQSGPAAMTAVLLLTAAITALAARAVGWIEDIAAGRALRRHRRASARLAIVWPTVAAVTAVIPLVILPMSPDAAAGISGSVRSKRFSLPPPSYRATLSDTAFARPATASNVARIHLPGGRMPVAALQRALDRWMAGQSGFDSLAVAVAIGGQIWTGEAHHAGAAPATRAADSYGIASVTKTFTTGLVLQEVANGRVNLDAPLPPLPGVAHPPAGVVITARHLLQHTSGLVDYPHAIGYDPERPLTPAMAVGLSLGTPLQSAPGEQVNYANVNYQYLGLLLEHTRGRPYGQLVATLARSFGLTHTRLDPGGAPGWTGFASGGIRSTVTDLARWGEALFTPGRVVPGKQAALLTELDEHNLAVGTWPLCPCSTQEGGEKRYAAIGQFSGHGGLYHFPGEMALALHVEPPVEGAEGLAALLGDEFRRVLRAGEPPGSERGPGASGP